MFQISNSKHLAHIDEETEEHLDAEDTQAQTSPPPTPLQEEQTVDIGPYFAAAVIGLSVIVFIIFKFLKKKKINND